VDPVVIARLIVLVHQVVLLLSLLVVVRAVLSGVPSVDYGQPLIRLIVRITDPVLQPVRRVLPTVGGLDLSPVVAILLLNLAEQLLDRFLRQLAIG